MRRNVISGNGSGRLQHAISATIESLECRRMFFAGQVDATFNPPNGFVIDQTVKPVAGGVVETTGLVVQSTGKTVVETTDATGDVILERWNANGSVDNAFGIGGKVDLSHLTPLAVAGPLAIASGDKLIASVGNGIFRLNADGSPDLSFGGMLRPGFSATTAPVTALSVDSNNNVDVIEYFNGVTTASQNIPPGSILQQFNSNGFIQWTNPMVIFVDYLDVVANGTKIDVVGGNGPRGLDRTGDIWQFNASDGSPDSSAHFQIPLVDAGTAFGEFSKVDAEPDGSLAVLGFSDTSGGPFLSRYSPTGVNIFTTPVGHEGSALKTQRDGKIIVGGIESYGDGYGFALTRFTLDGKRDATFGNGGIVVTSLGDYFTVLRHIAVSPDGRITAAGGDLASLVVERFLGDLTPLPGRIEAENFDNGGEGIGYHDTDAINQGLLARRPNTGVDIESTGTGGIDVGWTHTGEWLNYSVSVPSTGGYDLKVNVANVAAGGTFHIEVDGADVTGPMVIPNTGGWQSYVAITHSGISLTAGRHTIRIAMDAQAASGFVGNFDWFELTPAALPPPSPFLGKPFQTGDPAIEAENFDNGGEAVAYHDSEAANLGGQYRATGVDIEQTGDVGGGYDVGWTHPGEWLNYTVTIPTTGVYQLAARVASIGAGASFHVEFPGIASSGPIGIPRTAGWQTYTTVGSENMLLVGGTYFMRVVIDTAAPSTGFGGNFNWFALRPVVPDFPGNQISGTVFNDVNANGKQDAGESGVSGRTVYLDLQGINRFIAGDPTAITDANGSYAFHALPTPANYIVRLLAQSGSTLTSPNPVYGGFYWIPFVAGQLAVGADFGVLQSG